jgi:cellulose synthase/poly-beta-1,6-N-acetylglucosamine synthase-like glycosyltransferase
MIISAAYILILLAVVITVLPVIILLLEVIAGISTPLKTAFSPPEGEIRDRVGVLIPAHNEEEGLPTTIAKIRPQLEPGDRLLVVADNCSDRTAEIARSVGAEVVVRHDVNNIGKGFALDCGVKYFGNDPPEVVIIIDADCELSNNSIYFLTKMCKLSGRPVQCLDLMTADASPTPGNRFREFAWRVKNWVRPMGLSAVGLPCQLMGTGMAFPWNIIASAKLATGALAEDLNLGLDLAARGHPPVFCPAAVVTSEFPTSPEGGRSQQRRWEQGHLAVLINATPRFLVLAIKRMDANLFALVADAAVPPLSLLWLMILSLLAVSAGFWRMGAGSAAVVISLANFVAFMCALAVCWFRAGRDILPLRSIPALGVSVFGKIPLYLGIVFSGRDQKWVRTDRKKM